MSVLYSSLLLLFIYPQGYNNSKGVTLEASFTPDSQFVMIGKFYNFSFVVSLKLELYKVYVF